MAAREHDLELGAVQARVTILVDHRQVCRGKLKRDGRRCPRSEGDTLETEELLPLDRNAE